jgi:hypothetical protein
MIMLQFEDNLRQRSEFRVFIRSTYPEKVFAHHYYHFKNYAPETMALQNKEIYENGVSGENSYISLFCWAMV